MNDRLEEIKKIVIETKRDNMECCFYANIEFEDVEWLIEKLDTAREIEIQSKCNDCFFFEPYEPWEAYCKLYSKDFFWDYDRQKWKKDFCTAKKVSLVIREETLEQLGASDE